jgi:hypothetical protein
MTTHITMDELKAFRRGNLAEEQLASVLAHLGECRECGVRWPAAETAAAALITDLAQTEHPDLDELFAYVDGERSDEIARHLGECEQCSADVADATREKERLRPQPEKWSYGFLAAAAAITVVIGGGWLLLRQPPTPETPPRVIHATPPPAPGPWDGLIAEVRQARGVPMPAIVRELRGDAETFRGQQVAPAGHHLQPAGTVVASQQPRLTWRATNGERYVVTIVCNDTVAATSGPIAGGEWTPPRPLPRGSNCAWQIERQSDHAVLPAPPIPQPMFRVADEAALAEIRKAEAQEPRDEFVIGLLYARAGMQREAKEHLQEYVRVHPQDVVASEVLKSVKQW